MKLPLPLPRPATLLLAAAGMLATAQAQAQTANSLVQYLKFDGNTLDSSGNNNNGTASGTVSYTAGKVGSCLVLNGSTGYVSLPATIANRTALTISTWVYWGGGDIWQRIFDFGTGQSQYMFLTAKSYDNTVRFAITNSGNGAEQRVDTPAPLATNTWVYVTVTLGGGTARIYLNGVQAASSSTITVTPQNIMPTLNYVGKSQFPDALFTGRIDDFRMYNYALSATEVSALMAQTLPTLSPALAEAVSVYPNPAAGQARLELPAALSRTTATAEVLDATGRVAATHTLAAGSTSYSLPLAALAPGIYSLRLHTIEGIATKKLVIN